MTQNASVKREQWLVLGAALLGWMFDGVEMGLFPIAARPALQDLLKDTTASEADVLRWISYLTALFLIGAACGGILFGWLGDRMGRVRTMALSIFAYSLFTGACYFATDPWQLGVFRFLAALGMGGEWSLGVALVMECWPEKLRPLMAGIIGAAGNVGYLLVALLAIQFRVTPESWRWIMLACTAPAVLALLVLLVLPESKRWKQSVQKSGVKPMREVLTTRLAWPTVLATAFASVALIGTWAGVTGFLPSWADKLAPDNPHAKGFVQVMVSIGAIIGCFFSPLVGGRFGRRPTYFGLCLFSLLACGYLFRGLTEYNAAFLSMALIAGCATASFYGWLPLYLPELFPTRVRATGQGLSYNFGRVFAAAGVLMLGQVDQLQQYFGAARENSSQFLAWLTWTAADTTYPRACAVLTLIYLVGMVLIWLAPETKGKPLPD
jgi:MFS family permease